MPQGNIAASESHLAKTSKLVPGEAIALFVFLANAIERAPALTDEKQDYVLYMAIIVGLVVVPLILYRQMVRGASHYVISLIAFVLWVVSVQGDKFPPIPGVATSKVALFVSLAMAIFTFVAPLLVLSSEVDKTQPKPAGPNVGGNGPTL